jgi:hypothetical protein
MLLEQQSGINARASNRGSAGRGGYRCFQIVSRFQSGSRHVFVELSPERPPAFASLLMPKHAPVFADDRRLEKVVLLVELEEGNHSVMIPEEPRATELPVPNGDLGLPARDLQPQKLILGPPACLTQEEGLYTQNTSISQLPISCRWYPATLLNRILMKLHYYIPTLLNYYISTLLHY